MLSPFSIQRSTPSSQKFWRRLEVTILDMLISAVDTLQLLKGADRMQCAWQIFARQSAARQIAILAGLSMIFFCLGLLKGAL